MSTTLTWASSGLATKTGTTAAAMMADIVAMITAKAADPTFFWQVAGSSIAGTPYTIVLSRKDGSAGRIGILILTSGFSNIQPTLFEQLPAANNVFIMWFPAGTGSTLSNLNATSGTVCGNDTGAPYASSCATVASSYAANYQPFYFDSQEGLYFGFGDPGASTQYNLGAGLLAEDAAGTAYDCTYGSGNAGWGSFTSQGMPYLPTSGKILAGALPNSLQTVYAATKKQFYQPGQPGGWASLLNSSSDCILADNATSKVWFAPIALLSNTKGEGAVLKMRQFGFGPGSTNAFPTYQTTGPVVQARQGNHATAGSVNAPWLTNFKI